MNSARQQETVTTQKSILFLFMNKEQFEKEIVKTVLLIIAAKGIIYLGISLTREVKDLYNENYKPLQKEVKENLNKWK